MNTHIDTIAEWWETAERGIAREGDVVIVQIEDDAWQVEIAGVDQEESAYIRILARAPKPEPAWHDAVAVLANHRDYADEHRTVWVQIGGDEYDRVNIEGDTAAEHHLVNVTPLIEAKVTDETVDRVLDVLHAWNDTYPAGLGTKLAAAALGIEAE